MAAVAVLTAVAACGRAEGADREVTLRFWAMGAEGEKVQEIVRQYRVRVLGRVPEIKERFWLLSPERRLRHEAVIALSDFARESLFGDHGESA